MSSWLVIGASSFTGRHFCEYLRGKEVDVVEGSLYNAVCQWAERERFDYIVNFAALNVVAPSWDHPRDYMRVNVGLPSLMWDVLAKTPPKRYLHVSTPEVYGPMREWRSESFAFAPSTPYAVSRAAAEMMLRCYHQRYGLPVVFTRACNVYGPGQQLYRLIPKLVWSIKHGIRFPLEGAGASMRCFLHVDDVCNAYYAAAVHGAPGEAYHVSCTNLKSIATIARMVCNEMGVKAEDVIETAPERPGKDEAYLLRSEKIRELGWAESISLPNGIGSVVEWMEREWETLKDQSTTYEFKP